MIYVLGYFIMHCYGKTMSIIDRQPFAFVSQIICILLVGSFLRRWERASGFTWDKGAGLIFCGWEIQEPFPCSAIF